MTDLSGNIFFDGPVGRIEALLKEPTAPVTRAAIVCHPHPLFGGTMHNKVVYRIAKAFERAGFAVLRFNFRGTGQSEGEHDRGQGEQDDLRAAIQYIESKYPEADVWVAGFSFGSAVMLRAVCGDDRVHALIAAGVPVSEYDLLDKTTCDRPKLFVQGSRDKFGSVKDIELFVAGLAEPKRLDIIEDADHFFDGHLDELAESVSGFIRDFE